MDYAMMVLLGIVGFVSVAILSHLPPENSVSPLWTSTSILMVVMVVEFYRATWEWETKNNLRRLIELLTGREEVRPELAGTVQRLTNIVRELGE